MERLQRSSSNAAPPEAPFLSAPRIPIHFLERQLVRFVEKSSVLLQSPALYLTTHTNRSLLSYPYVRCSLTLQMPLPHCVPWPCVRSCTLPVPGHVPRCSLSMATTPNAGLQQLMREREVIYGLLLKSPLYLRADLFSLFCVDCLTVRTGFVV